MQEYRLKYRFLAGIVEYAESMVEPVVSNNEKRNVAEENHTP
jgi:hypothetical protein